jgi:two-component system, cell cycle sensor histidine kinase and response regulator CckA
LGEGASPARTTLDTYRHLVEMSLDAALLVNAAGLIVLANERAASLFSCARDELRGRALASVIVQSERAGRRCASPAGGSGVLRIGAHRATVARRSDGSELPVDVQWRSLQDDGGGPSIVTARDLSELERLTERVAALQRVEVVGRVAAGVTHDFNNLLTVILGFGTCVLDTLPEEGDAHADMLELMAAVERARALAGRLLSFSRQGKPQEVGVVDLGATVGGLERMLRHLLGGAIKFGVRVQAGLWPVCVDKASLEQVILNLALNARDAMPHGGALSVDVVNAKQGELREWTGASQPGARDYVALIVSDTGHGMAPDTQQRIFEPFFTTKALGTGTGLGLAMASTIVSEAGGFIRVHSEQGRGATFAVHLPRAPHGAESMCQSALLAEPAE